MNELFGITVDEYIEHLHSGISVSGESIGFDDRDESEREKVSSKLRICLNDMAEKGRKPDLSGTHLQSLDLSGVNLRGVNLTGASITEVDMSEADFRESNLTDVGFLGANVRGADFTGADVSGIVFCGAKGIRETKGLRRFTLTIEFYSQNDLILKFGGSRDAVLQYLDDYRVDEYLYQEATSWDNLP